VTNGLRPADERRHTPGPQPGWTEWWSLDWAADGPGDVLGGFVRLALYPRARVAWFWSYLVTSDHPGPVVVRDHEVPLPRGESMEVRAEGLWADHVCEVPFEHWTYGLEAFGVRLDDPADGFTGEIGDRMPVGFDLEWEVAGDRGPESAEGGYAQPGEVHGEVLLGRARFEVEGKATRAHGWGNEPWSAVEGLDALVTPGTTVRAPLRGRPVDATVVRSVGVPLVGAQGGFDRLVRALVRHDGAPVLAWAEWALRRENDERS
jgi:hypothetical protein